MIENSLTQEYEDELLEEEILKYHLPCVYIMHNHSSGLTKIGYTDNIFSRYRQIKNNIGTSPEILYTNHTPKAYDLEQLLHRKFEQYRREGEWFDLSEDLIREIRKAGIAQLKKTVYFTGVGYYSSKEENGRLVFRRVAEEFELDVPENAIKIVTFRECYEKFDEVFASI